MPNPHYYPDLAALHYQLFEPFKVFLDKKIPIKFEEVERAISDFFDSQSPQFCKKGIVNLPVRSRRSIGLNREMLTVGTKLHSVTFLFPPNREREGIKSRRSCFSARSIQHILALRVSRIDVILTNSSAATSCLILLLVLMPLRMQLNYLKGTRLSEASTVKMLSVLKALAQCHVVLGLIMLILSTLADYVSSRINTIRMYGLEECCSFYFIVTGLVGLCGAASYRRGLVITFLVMSIHAIIIFVPAIIIVSSFDIHFYQHECWGECDWHLLATSLPRNSRCQIMCGDHVDDNMRVSMTRLGTDYRLDAGLIAAAILELLLALATTIISSRTICSAVRGPSVEMVPLNGDTTSISRGP
ncbi:hypothetical protein RB195_021053 [Necator americanus]|uniref:Uncharacterized protein n=1 Tax=Necator americanus TaxID=51031 RepID=A0ABR1EB21_NECAM